MVCKNGGSIFGAFFLHVSETAKNDPGTLPCDNRRFFSSQLFNALTICATLSGRCSRISLMLTLPILTSLFTKKSNNENSPSIDLSSYGWDGKAESGTGGDAGCPLIDSARRNSAKALNVCANGFVTRNWTGKREFAHSMIGASSCPCFQPRSTLFLFFKNDNNTGMATRKGGKGDKKKLNVTYRNATCALSF